MAKVTQQDVVNFLKEKVALLSKDLEVTQNALSALEGSTIPEPPVKRGRKPKAPGTAASAAKAKPAPKPGGAKRGRKPKVQVAASEATPSEQAPAQE